MRFMVSSPFICEAANVICDRGLIEQAKEAAIIFEESAYFASESIAREAAGEYSERSYRNIHARS